LPIPLRTWEKYPFGNNEARATERHTDHQNRAPWNWHALHGQTLKAAQLQDLDCGSGRSVARRSVAPWGRTEAHVTGVPSSDEPNQSPARRGRPTVEKTSPPRGLDDHHGIGSLKPLYQRSSWGAGVTVFQAFTASRLWNGANSVVGTTLLGAHGAAGEAGGEHQARGRGPQHRPRCRGHCGRHACSLLPS
jgi:hypothetical protein